MRIKVGMKFYASTAIGSFEWTVARRTRAGVWLCTNPEEYPDGKLFLAERIAACIRHDAALDAQRAADAATFAGFQIGAVVHYNHGFGEWVRCDVTRDSEGAPALRPIALVGTWKFADDIGPDGYFSRMKRTRETFRPHSSCLFEGGYTRAGDPRALPEVA